jgi:hypothetical protein
VTGARAAVPAPAVRRPAPAVASRDAAEREADAAGAAAVRGTLPTRWSFASVPVGPPPDGRAADAVAGAGRPLDPSLRQAMEVRLGADLGGVTVHDDARAAAAVRELGTEGLAVGDRVALAGGGVGLLAHELAHVAQQRAAGAVAVQRQGGGTTPPATTLQGLPEADRKRIQVVTTTHVTVPSLADKFATTGTTVTLPLPTGVTTAFDPSVDAALQHGLSNVAGSLTTTVELTPAPLPPNGTVTLELDVPKVGKGLYRFTYHDPPAPAGGKGAAPTPRIVIEALGKATAPPGTTPPPAGPVGAPPPADPVADKIKNHSFTHGYTGSDLDALRGALAQVPDAQLSVVDGLTFKREQKHPTDPTEAGHYDPKSHSITMYDLAFKGSQTKVKGAGTVASDDATRAIVHEIGHAIDLAPMRKATVEKDKADAAVDALPSKFPDPNDPKGWHWDNPDQKKEIDAVVKAQKDAETKVLTTKSLSGTKTVKDAAGNLNDVIGTTAAGNKFREAQAKDGKAVSKYGDKDFQEAFAEAYSLYITSPDTLRALRPNVYDFLDKNLPK